MNLRHRQASLLLLWMEEQWHRMEQMSCGRSILKQWCLLTVLKVQVLVSLFCSLGRREVVIASGHRGKTRPANAPIFLGVGGHI